MITRTNIYYRLLLTVCLMLTTFTATFAEVGPNDLKGEDKEIFDKYRQLVQYGTPDEFYSFAVTYEEHLRKKGYWMLYYKLKNNEGFFALRHNMVYRAMQAAKELDEEMRQNGATQYFYLATGLMGDIYAVTQNRSKAEQYFTQALREVGTTDPKFTMRVYQSLAELTCLQDSKKALHWADSALVLARETQNVEYQSLSMAMAAYVHFMDGNSQDFFDYYDQYISLRSMDLPAFSHRYDNFMEIGKRAMESDYEGALAKLREGNVNVDSSLVDIRILTLERGEQKGFEALKRRFLEIDSIRSIMQNANFDQMAYEQKLMQSREEDKAKQKVMMILISGLLLLMVLFAGAYWWTRRWLIRKQSTQSQVPAVVQTPVNMDMLCREVLSKTTTINRQGLEIRYASRVANDFTLTTDVNRLRQILLHLLGNAVKFTAQGHILLRCEQQGNQLLIAISDTGVGIKSQKKGMLSSILTKLTKNEELPGQGLANCRRMARSLGGDVTLDESYTKGCRFVVSLPVW